MTLTPQQAQAATALAPSVAGRTQTEIENLLGRDGFAGQFGAREGARILCFSCRNEFPADTVDASDASRVEGESDPDDMAIVVAVSCPKCGTAGTLSLQFGPGAGPEETEVVAALSRVHPELPLAARLTGAHRLPDNVR